MVERPRVRGWGKGGKEVELPSVATAKGMDPMPTHVAEQVVVGVSTRGYERSLERLDESLESRGESESHVSRALIEKTTEKLVEFLDRKLHYVALGTMFIHGIEIGSHAYKSRSANTAKKLLLQVVSSGRSWTAPGTRRRSTGPSTT